MVVVDNVVPRIEDTGVSSSIVFYTGAQEVESAVIL